jgi:multiple antibiotic resistance protein
MSQELTLFVGMFTTLLAIINPLEALPVFLKLLEGKDKRNIAGSPAYRAFTLCSWHFSFSSSASS